MKPALVVLALATSCYSPSFGDCEVSCAGTVCPDNLECRAGLCRTAGATASCATITDRDSDGVADASDNCPDVMNTDQANEDADAYGDLCDPCPPYANATANVDTDGDGLGDGCDPRPTIKGDKIAVFEGFNAAPIGTSMNMGFMFVGGHALGTAPMGVRPTISWEQPAGGNETVSTQVTLTSMTPTTAITMFDQRDAMDPNMSTTCTLIPKPNDPTSFKGLLQIMDYNVSPLGTGTSAPLDQVTIMSLSRAARDYNCFASIANGPISLSSTRAPPQRPNMGIELVDASATLDWFMIVRSP